MFDSQIKCYALRPEFSSSLGSAFRPTLWLTDWISLGIDSAKIYFCKVVVPVKNLHSGGGGGALQLKGTLVFHWDKFSVFKLELLLWGEEVIRRESPSVEFKSPNHQLQDKVLQDVFLTNSSWPYGVATTTRTKGAEHQLYRQVAQAFCRSFKKRFTRRRQIMDSAEIWLWQWVTTIPAGVSLVQTSQWNWSVLGKRYVYQRPAGMQKKTSKLRGEETLIYIFFFLHLTRSALSDIQANWIVLFGGNPPYSS